MLRALLLSVFFQRTLENVVPETLDVFDTHVAVVSGAGTGGAAAGPGAKATDIEREITDKVDGFVRSFVDTGKEGGEVSTVSCELRAVFPTSDAELRPSGLVASLPRLRRQ